MSLKLKINSESDLNNKLENLISALRALDEKWQK